MSKAELERAIVDHLAKSLTANQRAALRHLPEDGRELLAGSLPPRMETCLYGLTQKAVMPGVEAAMARCFHAAIRKNNRWKATPLGLKVRARLSASKGGENG